MASPIFRVIRHPTRAYAIIQLLLLWIKTYFEAQKKVKEDQALVIETSWDQKMIHTEWAIYPYLFACGYIFAIGWYLLNEFTHAQYLQAHAAFKDLIVESARFFVAHPTRMKDRTKVAHPLLRFTQTIDGQTNCFPSMHVSLVLLSYQIIKDGHETNPLRMDALRQACIDICRSTMQTKQHSIIDVVGGIAITRQIYSDHFSGQFEDFIGEILPELHSDKLPIIRQLLEKHENNLSALLKALMKELSTPPT